MWQSLPQDGRRVLEKCDSRRCPRLVRRQQAQQAIGAREVHGELAVVAAPARSPAAR